MSEVGSAMNMKLDIQRIAWKSEKKGYQLRNSCFGELTTRSVAISFRASFHKIILFFFF